MRNLQQIKLDMNLILALEATSAAQLALLKKMTTRDKTQIQVFKSFKSDFDKLEEQGLVQQAQNPGEIYTEENAVIVELTTAGQDLIQALGAWI